MITPEEQYKKWHKEKQLKTRGTKSYLNNHGKKKKYSSHPRHSSMNIFNMRAK